MESGVLNQEVFSQILRGYSQRKRQGILEIRSGARMLQIYFLQGRIIDARWVNEDHVVEVAEQLRLSGWVPVDWQSQAGEYGDLFRELGQSSGNELDEESFTKVVKHRILDRIYDLDLTVEAFFAFKSQVPDVSREMTPAIPVGQLLLDLVAIKESAARVSALFPGDALLARYGDEDPSFSEDEEQVFDALETGPLGLEALRRRALLSRSHFYEALLSLVDRGCVGPAGAKASAASSRSAAAGAQELSAAAAPELEETPVVAARPADGIAAQAVAAGRPSGWGTALALFNARLLHQNTMPWVFLIGYLLCVAAGAALVWSKLLSAAAAW